MTVLVDVATVFRLTRPFRIDAFEEELAAPRPGEVVLRPLRVGICGSDLKLYTGTRERKAMMQKLPIALLHEAVAEVVAAGPGTTLSLGDRVVPSPNVPCTIAHPDRHPTSEEACYACRPGGAGENYCVDGYFLSSNADGMARSAFVHPEACTFPLPAGTPETLAVLSEPLATVLSGVEEAAPTPEGRFLILGNGAMALLTAIALRAIVGVGPDRILMTGRHWDERHEAVRDLATPVDEDGGDAGREAMGAIDVAFECVGGDSNDQTLALAVDMLRPGGRGILFGPSEAPLLFDTRKVIGKGLHLAGCNRAVPRHFRRALELAGEPDVAPLLERAIAPKEVHIEGTRDLDDALYYAWTKDDPGRAVTTWE